ncbi:ATP-binding cassette transporter, subfamily B, member 7, group TAP protein PpABCB7, partial [Reticulomyxa filosa]
NDKNTYYNYAFIVDKGVRFKQWNCFFFLGDENLSKFLKEPNFPAKTKMELQSTKTKYEPLIEVALNENGSPKEEESVLSKDNLSQSVSAQETASARKQTDGKDKGHARGMNAQEQELWNIARNMSSAQKKVTMLRLLEQARPERGILYLGIFLTFVGAGVYLGTPVKFSKKKIDWLTEHKKKKKKIEVMMGAIIDSISQGTDDVNTGSLDPPVRALCNMSVIGCKTPTKMLETAVLTLLVISIVGGVCSFGKWVCMEMAGERVVARLRKQLFCAILSQEVAMFDTTKTGELVSRISTDTTVLKTACTTQVAQALQRYVCLFVCLSNWTLEYSFYIHLLQSLVQVILSILYVFYLSWSLTLVMLSIVPVVVIVAKWYGFYYHKLSRINQDTLAHATDVATESITLIRTVKSFSKEDEQEKIFFAAIDETYKQGLTFFSLINCTCSVPTNICICI